MSQGRSRWSKFALVATALMAATALAAAACGGSTSDNDKTATAAAKGGTTAVATTAATKAAATSAATPAATAAATKAVSTPAASSTTAATAASGATPPSGTTGGGVNVADSALGKILVDAKGFTLYTFKNDVAGSGKSAAEAVTGAWPPLTLAAAPSNIAGATGAWAVFTRADGKTQVTYKGLPLYFFVNDKAAGDTTGDKVGDVWFVAVP